MFLRIGDGFIVASKQINGTPLFDSRYIDTKKAVGGKQIHPDYFSKFGFRFYEVLNKDEPEGSLMQYYKQCEDPAFIRKVKSQLKTTTMVPGCSSAQPKELVFPKLLAHSV